MPGALNEATVADTYGPALTVELPMSSCTVIVYNAGVFYQLGHGVPANFQPQDEHRIAAGMTVVIRQPINGIRFRNAVAGTPAKVTVIPEAVGR